MGNALCKESNVNNSLRPGRVLDSVGNLMCPNGLGKSKTGINKTYLNRHVLETGPKSNTMDSWHSSSLNVPDGAPKVIDRAPVAPPRKKRTTLERGMSPEVLKVKNGFKDVFGAESRRQSSEVQKHSPERTVDAELQSVSQSGYEIDAKIDEFSDFSKIPTTPELDGPKISHSKESVPKVSKVGNKKSDKFFGENLSDSLSNEPIVAARRRSSAKKAIDEVDKIDQFIEQNVLKKTDANIEVPTIEITKPDANVDVKASKKAVVKQEIGSKNSKNENQESLIKYIDETVGKETSLGKKAEFLMAMLEDYSEDRYLGMSPVEEPIIVPRKRKSRHICDDDDHIHAVLHQHEKESETSKKLITTEASIETPPRKPSRDFTRFVVAMDGYSDSDDSSFAKPIRKHRSPQRKTLPSPPMPPKFKKSLSESQFRVNISDTSTSTPKKDDEWADGKAHTPRMLKRIISMPTTANLAKPDSRSTTPQPTLQKSNSSSSFLIKDLQKAHISVGRFTPEDHAHNAADELVKPKSRLITRKISTRSSDSFPCTPTPTLEIPAPKFTIGSSEVLRTTPASIDIVPPAIPKRRKSSNSELRQDPFFTPVSHSKPLPKEILGYDLGSFLESSKVLHHHDVTNVIENVYNATDGEENIIREFQLYLEDQINAEINNPNSSNPNTVKLLEVLNGTVVDDDKLDDEKLDLVQSDDSNKSSDIDDCFDPEFEKIDKSEVEDKLGSMAEVRNPFKVDSRKNADESTDWFESGSDGGSVFEGSDKLGNMVHVKSTLPRHGRRESIEDVDSWFQNHNDSLPGEEEIIGVRKQRRGSDGFLAYDTSRQYPFGEVKPRRDSLSADLFEDITKLHEMGVKKDKISPLAAVKNVRIQERRGSDGLIFYDTSRKFPFGEPNTDLPKALEEQKNKKSTETKEVPSAASPSNDNENQPHANSGGSDHSTLLKYLSKENLIE